MEEAQDKFEPEWIWPDDEGTNVYAQGYGRDLTVIFSFSSDKRNPPTSLANRLYTKYEELNADDEIENEDPATTFPTINEAHTAIWRAIHHIWPQCISQPDLRTRLDSVVRVDSVDGSIEKISWDIYSHPLFPKFVQNLADKSLGDISGDLDTAVDFTSLVRYEQLGGRGCTTRVRLPGVDGYWAFKGVDFRTALHYSDNEGDSIIRNLIYTWHQECNTLQRLPSHPNILPPPQKLVTLKWPDGLAQPVICGALSPFYPGGTLASRIEESNKTGVRISLELKARWCANMAAAMLHTHRVAKTYHKDLKPGNFVADENDNLILCDWEQQDANPVTLAPEADRTWDVSTGDLPTAPSGRPQLQYSKYSGPPRRNVQEAVLGDAPWHLWNVFSLWALEQPWALELAEVFSLGRTMWILLRQPDSDFEDIEHPDELVTDWGGSEDIPAAWKQTIDRFISRDPNKRPDFSELSEFWVNEWNTLKTTNKNG
ncbi:hypothetical protein TWF730_001702 [Orbilia blumenaviensis]|uniref:Protein kinase domain-containing protein n=1 Tax=Orbilia blumenaviensis TaxID=1796055 RepID=A0AAV9UM51_9PEZI